MILSRQSAIIRGMCHLHFCDTSKQICNRIFAISMVQLFDLL